MKLRLCAKHIRDDRTHIIHEGGLAGVVDRMIEEIADDPEKDHLFWIEPIRGVAGEATG